MTFHLRIPPSTNLVISGDMTLWNISSEYADAPAALLEYGGLARAVSRLPAAGEQAGPVVPIPPSSLPSPLLPSFSSAVRCLSFALTDGG